MSGFIKKGWCPDAWHPMSAGDGLLMRVRPRLGRMTGGQLLGLCEGAIEHGNGLIDLTSRANLQIRGLSQSGWESLLDRLIALELVNADPVAEGRRNILVAPLWQLDDDSVRIAQALTARLDELPDLPAKIGFAIDAGPAPALLGEAGDFRIERGAHGGLILRADGRTSGVAVVCGQEVDALIALARWFMDSGGAAAGRMARHGANLPGWAEGDIPPAQPATPLPPGFGPWGAAYGLPFGQVEAQALLTLLNASGAEAVRTTPWRILLVEGVPLVPIEGLLHDPADPLAHADACPGAPFCPQATVETRGLARALAGHVAGRLHVSGCAKGCASARAADVTLTGREAFYDLSFNARPGSTPILSVLSGAEVLAHFGAI